MSTLLRSAVSVLAGPSATRQLPFTLTTHFARFKATSTQSRTLRNKDIPHEFVHTVNEEGKLEPLSPYAPMLEALNTKTHFLQLVHNDPPIVKLVDRHTVHQRVKAAKLQKRVSLMKNSHKEIQITWASDVADFTYKVKRTRSELESGGKVDVVFATKGNQDPPPVQEREERVGHVLAAVQDVAKEWKPREVKRLKTVLFLQSLITLTVDDLPETTHAKVLKLPGERPVSKYAARKSDQK